MSRYSLSKGMHIELRGREFVVGDRLPNGDYRLTDIAFDEARSVPGSELVGAFVSGDLTFLGDAASTRVRRKMTDKLIDDLSMLKDDDPRKKEARRRFAYIEALECANLPLFSKRTVKPLIEKVHAEIGDRKKPPFWKTLCYGWRKVWILSGKDLRILVPQYDKRGNTAPRFSNGRKSKGESFTEAEVERALRVEEIVHEVIREVYMNMQRNSVAEVHKALDERVADENKFRDPDDQLPIPSVNSVYAIINAMDPYEKDKARYGAEYADRKHRSSRPGPTLSRPLQRVEIDDTTLDLIVVDEETRMPVGRPTFTFAIDCETREPLGFYMSFDGPGYLAVMQCLIHAISPKTYLKEEFPEVQNDWPAYGLPEELIVDNGPGYVSQDLEDACKQLGITLVFCPVRTPNAKPRVERFFRGQNQRLLHNQPGTTFSSIFDRKDYDPRKNAVIGFRALLAMTHVFLVDMYARSKHRGLNGIPHVAWENGVEKYPPQLPRRQQELRVLLARIAQRKISGSGIEFENLFYNCEELAGLRRKGDTTVSLKYDPTDLGVIYVYDPQRDRYIAVPALDQKYAKGLTLWQHKVIKRYVRVVMRQQVDTDSLRQARKTIRRIVDEEWMKGNKTRTRSKLARFRGLRQPDFNSAVVEMAGVEGRAVEGRSAEGSVPMLPPAAHTAGVSDMGHDPRANGLSAAATAEEARLMPTAVEAVLAEPNGSNNGRKESSGKGRKKGAPPPPAAPRETDDIAGVPDEDDDSDIPEYSSSYWLPAKEV